MILVLILYMLFASTFTFGKMALAYCDPIFFIGARMIIGGLLLLGYQYFFNQKSWKFEKSSMGLYLQIILFHIYFAFIFEFWALQYVASAKACLMYNISPFITALLAYIFFSERLNAQKWLGLLIGCFGLLPILLAGDPLKGRLATLLHTSWPELALLGAVVSSAYGWMVMKKLMHKHHSPVMVNGIGMFGGGVLAFLTSLLVEGVPAITMPAIQSNLNTWALSLFGAYAPVILCFGFMLLLILIANIICYNLYGILLKEYSATFLSFAGFTTPLFAALYDFIFIGDTISSAFIASVVITCVGLYIFYRQELKIYREARSSRQVRQ
ncbi:MAG: DMT family transporter [Candidatus Dependentiae bacterium]|nr:DMT family transporter [Candidatus Dependentiae bacterium]